MANSKLILLTELNIGDISTLRIAQTIGKQVGGILTKHQKEGVRDYLYAFRTLEIRIWVL